MPLPRVVPQLLERVANTIQPAPQREDDRQRGSPRAWSSTGRVDALRDLAACFGDPDREPGPSCGWSEEGDVLAVLAEPRAEHILDGVVPAGRAVKRPQGR